MDESVRTITWDLSEFQLCLGLLFLGIFIGLITGTYVSYEVPNRFIECALIK